MPTGGQHPGFDPRSGINFQVPPGFRLKRELTTGIPYLMNLQTGERQDISYSPNPDPNNTYPIPNLPQNLQGTPTGAPPLPQSSPVETESPPRTLTPHGFRNDDPPRVTGIPEPGLTVAGFNDPALSLVDPRTGQQISGIPGRPRFDDPSGRIYYEGFPPGHPFGPPLPSGGGDNPFGGGLADRLRGRENPFSGGIGDRFRNPFEGGLGDRLGAGPTLPPGYIPPGAGLPGPPDVDQLPQIALNPGFEGWRQSYGHLFPSTQDAWLAYVDTVNQAGGGFGGGVGGAGGGVPGNIRDAQTFITNALMQFLGGQGPFPGASTEAEQAAFRALQQALFQPVTPGQLTNQGPAGDAINGIIQSMLNQGVYDFGGFVGGQFNPVIQALMGGGIPGQNQFSGPILGGDGSEQGQFTGGVGDLVQQQLFNLITGQTSIQNLTELLGATGRRIEQGQAGEGDISSIIQQLLNFQGAPGGETPGVAPGFDRFVGEQLTPGVDNEFVEAFKRQVFDPQRENLLADLGSRGVLDSSARLQDEADLFQRNFMDALLLQDRAAKQAASQLALRGGEVGQGQQALDQQRLAQTLNQLLGRESAGFGQGLEGFQGVNDFLRGLMQDATEAGAVGSGLNLDALRLGLGGQTQSANQLMNLLGLGQQQAGLERGSYLDLLNAQRGLFGDTRDFTFDQNQIAIQAIQNLIGQEISKDLELRRLDLLGRPDFGGLFNAVDLIRDIFGTAGPGGGSFGFRRPNFGPPGSDRIGSLNFPPGTDNRNNPLL